MVVVVAVLAARSGGVRFGHGEVSRKAVASFVETTYGPQLSAFRQASSANADEMLDSLAWIGWFCSFWIESSPCVGESGDGTSYTYFSEAMSPGDASFEIYHYRPMLLVQFHETKCFCRFAQKAS